MVRVKNIIISISIAIVLLFFCIYGVRTFLGEPDRADFCGNQYGGYYGPTYPVKEGYMQNCSFNSEMQTQSEACYKDSGFTEPIYDNMTGCQLSVKCNMCEKNYNNVLKEYSKKVFIIAIIAGIIAIVIGAVFFNVEAVGSGIMLGGFAFFTYGTIRYWAHIPDVGRFTLLGISLAVLIYIGIWLNKNKKITLKWPGKSNKKSKKKR